jgi:cytochrome b561
VAKTTRYNNVAIILHWVMAIGFFAMLGSGVVMTNISIFPIDQSMQFKLYQWHKSAGVLLLLAFGLRLGWRLFTTVPDLPGQMKPWEKSAAKMGHYALYVMMLVQPLTGWVMVSASVYGIPTIVFGLFEWPHIPGVEGEMKIEQLAKSAHFYGALAFAGLIAIHIGATVKHYITDKINLLRRMWWFSTLNKPSEPDTTITE